MNSKAVKFIIISSLIISLYGCFEVRREIKMYPNGGGVEKIYITLDKDFYNTFQTYVSADNTGRARAKLDSLLDNQLLESGLITDIQRTPGTSIQDIKITGKPDGSKEIYIHYIFDEPLSLLKIVKETTFSFSNQLPVSFSTMKFFDEGDKLRFKYVIRQANRSFDDSVTLNVFSSLLQSRKVYHSFTFPFEVIGSNAVSQSENTLNWEAVISDILYNQVEMTAEMKKESSIDVPYAEKIDKTISKVSQKDNPLIRVQVYNANKEPVKIGTGVILNEDLLVTNFKLMNLIEGQGYFSIIMGNDSLAGVDDMREKDLVPKLDLVYLRFTNFEKIKVLKYVQVSSVTAGTKVKIYYFPNTLSSIVYSIDGTITDVKGWSSKSKIIEMKPVKPLTLEGGAVFTETGDFIGMLTVAYEGEVGKMYVIPAQYIKEKLPRY